MAAAPHPVNNEPSLRAWEVTGAWEDARAWDATGAWEGAGAWVGQKDAFKLNCSKDNIFPRET